MRWLLVAAACGGAREPEPAPMNHAPMPKGETTPLKVELLLGYKQCTVLHHIAIVVDGVERARVETHGDCPTVSHPRPGLTVTDSHWRQVPTGPFDLPPGRHVIELRDTETAHTVRFEHSFPDYDDKHLLLDALGANFDDEKIELIGLARDFIAI